MLLESSSFQREMEDNAPEDGPDMLEQEESEEAGAAQPSEASVFLICRSLFPKAM